ncbi:hypothetical protein Bca52824_053040 [Brassica carinata]|uniref:Uncharacterized protein n=1 Tax=Brassica carinata TaxID=52824 RepID=A0A8X7UJA1_BRACI|nr:hypothetical protein Bca52824_053040 [Brassica carinata]
MAVSNGTVSTVFGFDAEMTRLTNIWAVEFGLTHDSNVASKCARPLTYQHRSNLESGRPPMQIVSVNWLRKDAVPCGLGHVPCFPTIDHKFQPLPYVQSKPNKYSPQLPLRFDH